MLLEQEKIQEIEQKIGYEFDNKYLLTQAFIRTSYVNESKERVKSNEVLEFYGDRALEFVVTKLMAEKFGDVNGIFLDGKPYGDFFGEYNSEYSESKLSQIKASLVEKKALASAMDELDLQKYLYLGKGDIEREIEEEKSVKEDLFEAILGAVAIDCNWNTEVLTKVVLAMHNTEGRISNIFINAEIEQAFEENYPSTEYNVYFQHNRELLSRKLLWRDKNKRDTYIEWLRFQESVAVLSVCDKEDKILACYIGYGETQKEAIFNAKENALNDKRIAKEINPIWVATDNVSLENAINLVQELIQKGLLEKAEYRYNQTHVDEQGNPRWKVELVIPKIGRCMAVGYTSKKDAKKAVAYRSICEIRDMIKGKIELFPSIYDARIRTRKYEIVKPVAIIKSSVREQEQSVTIRNDSLIGLLENGKMIKFVFDRKTLTKQGFEILGENKDKLNDELKKYLSLLPVEIESKNKDEEMSMFNESFEERLVGSTIFDEEYGEGKIVGYGTLNKKESILEPDQKAFKIEFMNEKLPRFIDYHLTEDQIYKTRTKAGNMEQNEFTFNEEMIDREHEEMIDREYEEWLASTNNSRAIDDCDFDIYDLGKSSFNFNNINVQVIENYENNTQIDTCENTSDEEDNYEPDPYDIMIDDDLWTADREECSYNEDEDFSWEKTQFDNKQRLHGIENEDGCWEYSDRLGYVQTEDYSVDNNLDEDESYD